METDKHEDKALEKQYSENDTYEDDRWKFSVYQTDGSLYDHFILPRFRDFVNGLPCYLSISKTDFHHELNRSGAPDGVIRTCIHKDRERVFGKHT